MSLFAKKMKFKKKVTGKGADSCAAFYKIMDVLNYKPKDYGYTPEYADVLQNSENYIRKIMKNLALDDQSVDALQLDNMIDVITKRMECSVDEQYTNHLETISRLHDVYQEEIEELKVYRGHLIEDIERCEKNLEKYREIQKTYDLVW